MSSFWVYTSERTLKRKLASMNLSRRKNKTSLISVSEFLSKLIMANGMQSGYRWMYQRCLLAGYRVSRLTVSGLLSILDREGGKWEGVKDFVAGNIMPKDPITCGMKIPRTKYCSRTFYFINWKTCSMSQKSQRRSWNRKQTFRRDTERFDKPWLVYLCLQYRQSKNRGILATSANGILSILDIILWIVKRCWTFHGSLIEYKSSYVQFVFMEFVQVYQY